MGLNQNIFLILRQGNVGLKVAVAIDRGFFSVNQDGVYASRCLSVDLAADGEKVGGLIFFTIDDFVGWNLRQAG